MASNSAIEQIRSNTPLRIPLAWAQVPGLGIALFAPSGAGDPAPAPGARPRRLRHGFSHQPGRGGQTELEGFGIEMERPATGA